LIGPEVITGDLFGCPERIHRTWEFNIEYASDGTMKQAPIRNMAIPYFFYGLPLLLLKHLTSIETITDLIKLDTNTLLYFPRVFMALVSIGVDIFLFKIATLCRFDRVSVITVFASSFVPIVFLPRTFSNSIETLLFTILNYLVIKSIKSVKENNCSSDSNSDSPQSEKDNIKILETKNSASGDQVQKSNNLEYHNIGKQLGILF